MFKRKVLGFALAFGLSLTLTQSNAHAYSGYAGGILGPSFGTNSNGGTAFAFGVQAGYKVTPNFGLGLYFTAANLGSVNYSNNNPNAPSTASVNEVQYVIAASPTYFPWADLGFYGTAKVGLGLTTASASVNPNSQQIQIGGSTTNFAVGGGLGWLQPIVPNFGVSAELTDIWVSQPYMARNAINLIFGANYLF